jgi:hypothetical protein
VLRGSSGRPAGRIHDQNSKFRRSIEINVVHSNARPADDFQLPGFLQQFAIDGSTTANDDGVSVRDNLEQLLASNFVVNDRLDRFGSSNDLDARRVDAVQQKGFEHYRLPNAGTYKVTDSLERFFDVRERIREGQPDIAFAIVAKCGSGQYGNTRFIQQPVRKFVAR